MENKNYFYIRLFVHLIFNQCSIQLLMIGFELRSSVVGCDCSANCAPTIAQMFYFISSFLLKHLPTQVVGDKIETKCKTILVFQRPSPVQTFKRTNRAPCAIHLLSLSPFLLMPNDPILAIGTYLPTYLPTQNPYDANRDL